MSRRGGSGRVDSSPVSSSGGGRSRNGSSQRHRCSTRELGRVSSREIGAGGRGSSREFGADGELAAADADRLSSFYKQRFGSRSPEEYMNLRLLHIDDKMPRENVRKILEEELKPFGRSEIKVMKNSTTGERLVYVNFRRPDAARRVRLELRARLQRLLGRRLVIDPAGVVRDRDGRLTADRFYRNKSPVMSWNLREDESAASRTLFIGNLPADITETEVRDVLERHGRLDDIDIKRPVDTNAAYAFVMFQTMEQARSAKEAEHNTPIRPSTRRCKIGYGKSQVSRRLWVGGLGLWTNEDMLTKEFDRYGLIDRLDYESGAEYAYIRFAEQQAAMDACEALNHFPLGGKQRCILVDFAKDIVVTPPPRRDSRESRDSRKRRATSSSQHEEEEESHHRDIASSPPAPPSPPFPPVGSSSSGSARRRHHSPAPSTPRDQRHSSPTSRHSTHQHHSPRDTTIPVSPEDFSDGVIDSERRMHALLACTWIGVISLKKTSHGIHVFRVDGSERLLQLEMRDEDGLALPLAINQRVSMSRQESLMARIMESEPRSRAVMLAAARQTDDIRPLVRYLLEKDGAGVIPLSTATLYVFPFCPASAEIVRVFAPQIRVFRDGCRLLLFVLLQNAAATPATPTDMASNHAAVVSKSSTSL